jgi:hypothetical protein
MSARRLQTSGYVARVLYSANGLVRAATNRAWEATSSGPPGRGSLKILQINNLYRQRGGEEIVADSEASLLREGGHEVDRLLVRNPDRALTATRLLAAAPWNVAQERSVKRRIRESRPDVAHVHNTWFALSPSVIRGLHT